MFIVYYCFNASSDRLALTAGRLSVNLEVSGGGAVLPAAQGLDDGGATQRARPLAVEPQTQAVLAEHVLQRNAARRQITYPSNRA